MLVYIAKNKKTCKRLIGKVKNIKEISKDYNKVSIVAFCKNETEMNYIYNLYLKDLNAIKDKNYENQIEKAVNKNEVSKK